jgi:hypothetical protein
MQTYRAPPFQGGVGVGSERSGVHGLGATGRCIFIPFALSEVEGHD